MVSGSGLQTVAFHVLANKLSDLIIDIIDRILFIEPHHWSMAESSTEPVGLWLGLQAGAFLGLYFGFSLALVSALTNPDELMRIVYLITAFPLAGGILLGPFLAKENAPSNLVFLPYNERWKL